MATQAQPAKYESPLRAAQAEQTRTKLLEAATDLLAEAGSDELTVRSVAARAAISVPTAYRYFPSREELLDAVSDWINQQVGFSDYPDSLDSVVDFAWVLYPGFERHETLVRAQLAHPAGRELRSRSIARRTKIIRRTLATSLPGLDPQVRDRYAALVHLLLSATAWSHLHDRWGLDGEQTAQLTGWALSTLIEAIQRDPYALSHLPHPSPERTDSEVRP